MKTSDLGKRLIKNYEGLRLRAYQDLAGVWTIGYGHTGRDVTPGKVITEVEADALFDQDLVKFERGVESLVKVPVQQHEFDALVSLAYNIGLDIDQDTIAEGLGDSTLLRKLNAGDRLGAALEWPKWCRAGGKVRLGLIRRRLTEALLFTKTRPVVTV